jgi:transcription antitermination factor NusG
MGAERQLPQTVHCSNCRCGDEPQTQGEMQTQEFPMKGFIPEKEWYVLQVRTRFERTVACHLQAKDCREYLPVYRSRRQWADRTKEIELPLFPGYVFCKMSLTDRLPILVIPGVIGLVSFGRMPVSVPEQEILAVQNVVKSGLAYQPCTFLTGQRVRVEYGPLSGMEGVVVEAKNGYRLIISVQLLRRSVSVEIDQEHLKPIPCPLPQAI